MKKKTTKLFSILLCLTMLFSCVSISLPVSAAVKMETKNGLLDFEAENTTYTKDRLGVLEDKMFSGGKGLKVLVEDKEEPASSAPAHIDLSFKADKAGTYTIWMRNTASVADQAGQSVFLSLDGGEYAWTKLSGEIGQPAWTKLGTVTVATAGGTGNAKLRVRQSKDIVIDRFIITDNASYTPDDAALGIKSGATATPSKPAPTSASKLATKGGFVMEEAEKLSYNKEQYTLTDNKDASGGKVLAVNTEDKTVPAKDAAPHLDLSFTPDKNGTYSVWLRLTCTPENSTGNSVFLSVDGGDYAYSALSGSPTEFSWHKVTSIAGTAGQLASVRIINRQKVGITFDKVLITDNRMFVPSGMGGEPSDEPVALPSGVYPTPSITPPPEHPRLMFRASDIPTIRANFEADQNKAAYEAFQKMVANPTDGKLKPPSTAGKSNFSATPLNNIEALAFDYAINGNEASGNAAISAIKNYYNTVEYYNATDSLTYRYRGMFIFTVAQVYDWCYPLMDDAGRKELTGMAESIALDLDIGYPPNRQGSVSGHGGEVSLQKDLMSLGIATYDERPDIYNYVAGRFLSEWLEPRNYWYKTSSHNQGNAYGDFRGSNELWAAWLFKRMSGVNVFSEDQQYFPYEWLYSRRADGQVLRDGDDYWQAGTSPYWTGWLSTLGLCANLYGDEYLKREFQRENPNMASFSNSLAMYTPVTHLAFNDPNLNGKAISELPLTRYFAAPKGMMIARTGWNDGVESPDVLVSMEINEHYPANHAHLQNGHFQIYYKGMLTGDSGRYDDGYGTDHDANYHKRSIAHNILTVYDPNEKMMMLSKNVANDGGQRAPVNGGEAANMEQWMNPEYTVGEVLGHEFGPDPVTPDYTYLKGDITKAYTSKVDEVLRSMLFLPLDDEAHPGVMLVMDKVTAADASFKKSFLLHVQEEPTVNGNRTVIERTEKDYNGRLVVDTLLPKADNTAIEKIGGEGKECWIDGKNYGATKPFSKSTDQEGQGWGRIEISPKKAAKTDYFLQVMSVSDAGGVVSDLDSTLIEGENIVGAQIADRVAIFAKDKERLDGPISFTIPGSGNFKVAVCGIKEGTWAVGDTEVVVSKDGGIAYFDAPAGDITLTYKNSNAGSSAPEPTLTFQEGIGIKLDKSYLYSDAAPVLVNGRTLVPMRVIFEKLGAKIDWDEAAQTVTGTRINEIGEATTVKLTIDSDIAYVNDVETKLDSAPILASDRTMVPIRFIAESLGATVGWDPFSKTVNITSPKIARPPVQQEGYAKIVASSADLYSEEFYDTNSWDGDYETLWSAEGEHYVTYEFDQEYNVAGVELFLNPNSGRSAVFEILYSNDGKNFTSLYNGKGNGKIADDWETFTFQSPVKAKYMRYFAKGSDISMWNGLKEIRFKLAK